MASSWWRRSAGAVLLLIFYSVSVSPLLRQQDQLFTRKCRLPYCKIFMVKIASRARTMGCEHSGSLSTVLEQTETTTPGAEARPKAREHGFAVLFAACVELQEVCFV